LLCLDSQGKNGQVSAEHAYVRTAPTPRPSGWMRALGALAITVAAAAATVACLVDEETQQEYVQAAKDYLMSFSS
jgi:hypothetical protein